MNLDFLPRKFSLEEFRQMKKDALRNQDYERAAKLRDFEVLFLRKKPKN